jgi:spermidine synthase
MGFTLMALEVLLLLGFQAVYGYVYRQLAVLISVVMMGMALGSWLGLRRIGADNSGGQPVTLRYVGMIQIVSAISPMLLYCFFLVCERSNNSTGLLITADVLFPIAGLLCGMLGGYQFPLASSVFFAGQKGKPGNTGTLYAVDLLGACIGAIVLCAYLVPVFGLLKTAILILVLNLATALLAFTAALPEEKLPA